MGHIVTVTPNPSIDLLFEAGTLVWDDANRVGMPRRRAGGQGVNVARAVHALGGNAVAIALLGGAIGDELAALLRAEGIALRVAIAPSETRVFVAVREHDSGRSLLLNPRGPMCGPAEEEALLREVERTATDWVVSSGSVPPGFGPDFHARVRDAALAAGARVVVDGDGRGLREAAPGCALLVPNLAEAERLLDRRIAGVRDAASAARALLGSGTRHVAITMGAEGAVLATADGPAAFHARAPDAPTGASAVGAGDAFLAALLLRLDDVPARDALRYAVAAGTAVLHGNGADLVDPNVVERLLPSIDAEEAG